MKTNQFSTFITHDKVNKLVVPHFDGHPLASRPIMMNGNARPHNPYSARLSATAVKTLVQECCEKSVFFFF
jgi:hypothetical protein